MSIYAQIDGLLTHCAESYNNPKYTRIWLLIAETLALMTGIYIPKEISEYFVLNFMSFYPTFSNFFSISFLICKKESAISKITV